jgi:hypothetical protein
MSDYKTKLPAGMTVFSDRNTNGLVVQAAQANAGMGRGYVARDFDAAPFGTYTAPFSGDVIPRNEWAERAEALDVRKASAEHIASYFKAPILNQSRRPYCWCYGVAGAMQTAYAIAGQEVPHLSATSAAAKIKNYTDVGGWAGEAIEGIQRFGMSTVEYWPEAALDRRYDTPEQRRNAALHKTVEFEELPSQSFDAVATELLHGRPVTLGLLWWGHLVFATRLVVLGRDSFGVVIRNSWGTEWETGGKAVLVESRATPHEAFSIRSVTLYHNQQGDE